MAVSLAGDFRSSGNDSAVWLRFFIGYSRAGVKFSHGCITCRRFQIRFKNLSWLLPLPAIMGLFLSILRFLQFKESRVLSLAGEPKKSQLSNNAQSITVLVQQIIKYENLILKKKKNTSDLIGTYVVIQSHISYAGLEYHERLFL